MRTPTTGSEEAPWNTRRKTRQRREKFRKLFEIRNSTRKDEGTQFLNEFQV